MIDLTSALVLVVTADSGEAQRLRKNLEEGLHCRVLLVTDVQTAVARIAGGGVDLVIVSLPPASQQDTHAWEPIRNLRHHAPQLPVILWCDVGTGNNVVRYLGSDPSLSVFDPSHEAGIPVAVRAAIERRRAPFGLASRDGSAHIISLQGAKGGVGTTTVALNLASALAAQGKTILAEIRPAWGTLSSYFGLRRQIRTIADLAAANSGAIEAADVRACLWPCDRMPGLSILFGPQSIEPCRDLQAEHVDQLLGFLANCADYVVIDLPHCFSTMSRSALRASDSFVLVLEPDPLCVQAAQLVLRGLEAENLLSNSTGAVIVNRVSLAAPLAISEVERGLGLTVLANIPPAPDLCLLAHTAHTPIVTRDPDSLLAETIVRLAASITSRSSHTPQAAA